MADSANRIARLLRGLGIGAVAFVAIALALDAWVGASQPVLDPGSAEGVLYTLDADGGRLGTRLVVLDDGDVQWVQSGHHFRGWYRRVLENPAVELERDGKTAAYHAVPIDTPETEARIRELLIASAGAVRFALIRTVLLFADIKPVRLDPRTTATVLPPVPGGGSIE
jgi:hypothetical protein